MTTYKSGSLIADRYEVVSNPLMGGMGIVYLCFDLSEEIPVALKTFKKEFLSNRDIRSRFLKEGNIWVQLGKHSNIVQCYQIESIPETGEIFFILELIPKEEGRMDASLRSWLFPGRRLPIEQALLFSLQIVRGMKYAAIKFPGLIHRDLKPENLLIGTNKILNGKINDLHITDFGLVTMIERTIHKGHERQSYMDQPSARFMNHHTMKLSGVVGTPLYMAPEQWTNNKIGVFTDVYAFGCILYEMLTGRTYLTGVNIEQIRSMCCKPQSINISGDIPQSIRNLLLRALELLPEMRFSSWDELETSLNTICSRILGYEIPKENLSQMLDKDEQIRLSHSFRSLASEYFHIGNYKEAKSNTKKAISISKVIKNQELEFIGLLNLSDIQLQEGNYNQGIANCNKALSYFRKKRDPHGQALALRRLGDAYTRLGDYNKAIIYMKQAIDLSDKFVNVASYMNDLISLGTLMKYTGDVPNAIQCFEESLAIARSIGNKTGEASAMIALGIIYKNQGDFKKAMNFHINAFNICHEIGYRHGEMTSLINLGITYKNIREYQKAIDCYKKALPIVQELGDKGAEASVFGNLGRVYFLIRDPDLSLSYLNKSLEIAKSIGNKHGEATTIGAIGNSLTLQGDISGAKLAFIKAIQIANEIGDINVIAENCFDLAYLLANHGEYEEAKNYANLAAQIWQKIRSYRYQHAMQLIMEIQRFTP